MLKDNVYTHNDCGTDQVRQLFELWRLSKYRNTVLITYALICPIVVIHWCDMMITITAKAVMGFRKVLNVCGAKEWWKRLTTLLAKQQM